MSANLTVPMSIAFGDLLSDNLAPDGAVLAWDSVTSYAAGSYVYVAATKKRYISQQGSNVNHDPTVDNGTWWLPDGWVNSWRALAADTANATIADDATGIFFEIEADDTYTHIGLLGVKGASARVVVKNASAVTVHDETQTGTATYGSADFFRPSFIFDDLPIESGFTIEITIADTGVSGVLSEVAKVVIGKTYALGALVSGDTRVGFEDFSIKEQDEFGDWNTTERGYSDLATFEVQHATNRTRWLKSLIVSKRVTPCLYWVATDPSHHLGLDMMDTGLFVYGYADSPECEPVPGLSNTIFDVVGLSFNPPGAAAYTAITASPPEAFGVADWGLAAGGTTSLDVTITAVDPIAADIEYRYKESSSGTWGSPVSTGGVVGFSIPSLSPDTAYDVQIRPTNVSGDGDWSDTKSETTNANLYAQVILERDFASNSMLSSEYITFAVSSAYREIQIISQGIGDGTATSPIMTIEVSDDNGATWETGAYQDGYVRGGAYVQLGGSGNPQTRMFSSAIFGAGGGISRLFNVDDGNKPHANTFTRDSTNMFARISTIDNAAVTHWRLTANADVTGGFIRIIGVLA